MIPFASQRSGGGDLATHLLNEQDNEYVEIADLRGAIADDLTVPSPNGKPKRLR